MKAGAHPTAEGTKFVVWAPHAGQVTVWLEPAGGGQREIPLNAQPGGWYTGSDTSAAAGDAYGFRLDGGPVLPDPASRAQRDDVHGLSLIVDASGFAWTNAAWKRPRFRDLVLTEIHLGTFTAAGTFRSAISRLPELRAVGFTAIELMPVADFPGRWNWGYDGVLPYAPARAYGSPDDLRALVDAAHEADLAVILDVVYNHFGPAGNVLGRYAAEYFSTTHHTPWGSAFNLDGPDSGPVREFFTANPPYWMDEFHIDGFRFDATHEIPDDTRPHVIQEMTAAVHTRGGYVICEDSRNAASVIAATGWASDGVWADDFHHAVRVSQTGERGGYYGDFAGTLAEVADCLRFGWLYRGKYSANQGRLRGTPTDGLAPAAFVHCVSNHDQTGNRALGERLSHLIRPEAYRALSALLCFNPHTPLFFMGQEWAASTPFLYFCDHDAELGEAIRTGRRREFAGLWSEAEIPDPQDEATFLRSKLAWPERADRGDILSLHAECLRLRAAYEAFRPASADDFAVSTHGEVGVLRLRGQNENFVVVFTLGPVATVETIPDLSGPLVLSSEETRFGGSGISAWSASGELGPFPCAETLLLRGS